MSFNNLSDFLEQFKVRSGFGVTGAKLDVITGYLNERIPNANVRINIPYGGFNVRGKVSDVHREVYGVMPWTYLYGDRSKVIKEQDAKTFFYGDNSTEGRLGVYLPFLSECDVYFVKSAEYQGDVLIVDLVKGPSWREYL